MDIIFRHLEKPWMANNREKVLPVSLFVKEMQLELLDSTLRPLICIKSKSTGFIKCGMQNNTVTATSCTSSRNIKCNCHDELYFLLSVNPSPFKLLLKYLIQMPALKMVILLLGIYPKELRIYIYTMTYGQQLSFYVPQTGRTQMFISSVYM